MEKESEAATNDREGKQSTFVRENAIHIDWLRYYKILESIIIEAYYKIL